MTVSLTYSVAFRGVEACPVERPDDFNHGLSKTKAIYLPHLMAYPQRYVVDPQYAGDDRMSKCVEACGYGAIELDGESVPRDLIMLIIRFAEVCFLRSFALCIPLMWR